MIKTIRKPIIITGLDISSTKVAAVALEASEGGIPRILDYERVPTKGMSHGSITDLDEVSKSISKVLTKLGEKIQRRPENIYANITGESIKGEKSRGMIPLSSRGREVTKSDIERCVNAASTIRLTFDREIIHKIVLNFSIDDQPAIKNALGLYASRLYCEMYMITANLNHIQNIYKCVNNAGYDVREVVYSGIADEMSLLEEQWKEEGVALLDMGASVSELSLFYGGALSGLEIMLLGGDDVKGSPKESAQFAEIVTQIRSKIDEYTKKGPEIKSVVITGGLAFAQDVAETLEERLSRPVRMGAVKNIQGNISSIDSLRAITAIGLARYAQRQQRSRMAQAKNLVQNISNKVVEIFNDYF